jgi:ATP-binding cassette subfamily B protein
MPAYRASDVRHVLGFYASFLRDAKLRIAAIAAASVLGDVSGSVLTPIAAKRLVDALSGAPAGSIAFAEVAALVGAIVATRAGVVLGFRIASSLRHPLVLRTNERIEARILSGLLAKPAAFFADHPVGSLTRKMSRLVDGCDRIFDLIVGDLVPWLAAFGAMLVLTGARYPSIALAFVAWIVLAVLIQQWGLANYLRAKRDAALAKGSEIGGITSDILANAVTVKSFSAERREQEGFGRQLASYTRLQFARWNASENIFVGVRVLGVAVEGIVLLLFARAWTEGTFSLGDFVLVQGFLGVMASRLETIIRMFRVLEDTVGSAREMIDILEERPKVRDAARAKSLSVKRGEVAFRDVSFSYGGRRVLDGFSLRIAPGERVAFVGASGAGKSTVIKLLMRFYDPQKGAIRIDGQNISKATQESLRRMVALVPQDPLLFHRSVRENIAYARPDASLEEVVDAAKKARCHDFISGLKAGYDTLVGERGVKLSGGERQRVAIARAILANAPILVLDEATSSLDSISEALIQEALEELMAKKTVVVIAHRLSTIRKMDRIVVMDEGTIVDEGTHRELLRRAAGPYARLWNIQAGAMREVG